MGGIPLIIERGRIISNLTSLIYTTHGSLISIVIVDSAGTFGSGFSGFVPWNYES